MQLSLCNFFFLLSIIIYSSCVIEEGNVKIEDKLPTNFSIKKQNTIDDISRKIKKKYSYQVDSSKFNNEVFKYYNEYFKELNGFSIYEKEYNQLTEISAEIISTILFNDDSSLIYILLDRSGSMENDIKNLRKGILNVLNQIPEEKFKLGIAVFGDKQTDSVYYGQPFFKNLGLFGDSKSFIKCLDTIKTLYNLDLQESNLDATYVLLKHIDSLGYKNNFVITISDAPSLVPPFSDYSIRDVSVLAEKLNVKISFIAIIPKMEN